MSVGNQPSYLSAGRGLVSWITSGDHKRIGMMFLGWTLAACSLGAIMGLFPLIKSMGGRGLEPRFLVETVAYHRFFLVFLFLVPAIPVGLGHFLLPLQLGARNMALPLLSRASLAAYVGGFLLLLVSLVVGPVAIPWTLTAPLSMAAGGSLDLVASGLALVGLSWLLTGVNFLVTVHTRRASGMEFFDLPVMTWSLYLTSYMLVAAGAVMCCLMGMLVLSGVGAAGLHTSQPDLWNRIFWFVVSPMTVFALVPAVGVVFEIIAGLSRRAVVAYRTVVGSMIALLGLSFVAWALHLTAEGPAAIVVGSALSVIASVPVALLAYSLLATLNQGAIDNEGPVTFVLGFLLHGGIVCLMALILASPALGGYLGATMFATAQLDYLIWGGVLFAFLAGLHYWWPKMTGVVYPREIARVGAVLAVVGLNLALLPRLVMGTHGVSAELLTVIGEASGPDELSALGWLIFHSGLLVIMGNLLTSTWSGAAATVNPWGAATLEWRSDSPPVVENFVEPPEVNGLYRY